MHGVRLETERLVLAPHTVADFPDMAALWADAAVVSAIGLEVAGPVQTWARLLRFAGLWPLLGYGYWAVRERATGRFVGDLGFGDFHREVTPSISGLPEAGWVLAGAAQRHGYAREAMGAALAWLDQRFERSVCLIAPDNGRSLTLAAVLGYGHRTVARIDDRDTLLLQRFSPSAERGRG